MSLLVTDADVALAGELSRRLRIAATALGMLAPECASLLTSSRWSGTGAAAAREETAQLARRLASLSGLLTDLGIRADRDRETLSVALARRRAAEAHLLDGLGRLARLPGDIEAMTHEQAAALAHEAATGARQLTADARQLTAGARHLTAGARHLTADARQLTGGARGLSTAARIPWGSLRELAGGLL